MNRRTGNDHRRRIAGVASSELTRGSLSDELENRIIAMAMTGHVARAARAAVRRQQSIGLPVTFRRGNRVLKKYADGQVVTLELLDPVPAYTLPPSAVVIGKK